jgi:sigma-B regulation protein RsbU (phosphoserine phosphatase)
MKDGKMLGADGLVRLAGLAACGGGGGEYLDDLFWRLSQEMTPGAGLDDDVSAIVLEFAGT